MRFPNGLLWTSVLAVGMTACEPGEFCGSQFSLDQETVTCEPNSVSDLSPLADLPNLKQLILAGTRTVDLASLGGYSSLVTLTVERREILDLAALPVWANLKQLNLRYWASAEERTALWKAFPNSTIRNCTRTTCVAKCVAFRP